MGKPHPIELRERVVAFVNEGHSNREAARHFRVSPRFVNNMMILHRSSGSLAAAKQGHPPGGAKLMAHADWVRERMSAHGETTLDELCVALILSFDQGCLRHQKKWHMFPRSIFTADLIRKGGAVKVCATFAVASDTKKALDP